MSDYDTPRDRTPREINSAASYAILEEAMYQSEFYTHADEEDGHYAWEDTPKDTYTADEVAELLNKAYRSASSYAVRKIDHLTSHKVAAR